MKSILESAINEGYFVLQICYRIVRPHPANGQERYIYIGIHLRNTARDPDVQCARQSDVGRRMTWKM